MAASPGHVFVVHSDLKRLLCDVYVLPTSGASLETSPKWASLVPRRPSPTPGWLAEVERASAAVPTLGGGQAVFVNSGGHSGSSVAWLMDGVRAGLDAAVGVVSDADPRNGRERALIGMPLFGTGKGGFASRRGEVIKSVVALARTAAAGGPDVVIVCRDRASYSAVQYERRQLEAPGLPPKVEEAAQRLAVAARQGRLALFLGAGVSMGAGLPSWRKLISDLAAQSDTWRGREENLLTSVLDGASILRNDFAETFADRLKRALNADGFALGHALAATLRVRGCVTTNFDHMYERAVAAARDGERPVRVPTRGGQGIDRDSPWVVKMHGDLDDQTVLTRQDFLDFDLNGRPLLGVVQTLLLTQHLLLVGCSMTDDNLIRLAHEVQRACAAQRGDTDSSRLGSTLLLPWPDDVLEQLWGRQFEVVPATALDRRQVKVQDPEAFRAVDVFLDRVAFHAAMGEGSFLVDDTFGELGDATDRDRAAKIRELREHLRGAGPEWDDLRAQLDRLFPAPHREDRRPDALAAELGVSAKALRSWLREPDRDVNLPFVRKHLKHDGWRFTDLEADLVVREWQRTHRS